VQKALKAGRIHTLADGNIDVAATDVAWTANTAPRAQAPARHRQEPKAHAAAHPTQETSEPARLDSGSVDYSRARAVREGYMARLAKMLFEERSAKLVARAEVEVAAFNRFRAFRDGMLNIPDRLAAVLAAEGDAARVHELLASEIRKALQEFADANG
jgi:hypothetical protein